MSTIISIPAPDANLDDSDALPSFTNDDASDAIYLEFAPGYTADEQAWFARELEAFIQREADAVRAARRAEQLAGV